MSSLVVLQKWFGELPDGVQVEKDSFQIILEGDEVERRRGKGTRRLFIGFVGKLPTEAILYQPVIDSFRDLIPQIELQIRIGLVQWRKDLVAEAQKMVAEAKQLVESTKDDNVAKHFAEDALKAAEANLATLTEQSKVEDAFPRRSNPPSKEDIEAFLKSIREQAEQATTEGESQAVGSDAEADQQNL